MTKSKPSNPNSATGNTAPCVPGSMPDAKKKAIVDKLKESGKADDIVKGIEDGDIKMFEMNDEVRKKYSVGEDTIALKVGEKIYIDPNASDAVAAVQTAHEGTHVLDKSENITNDDTIRREMKAFNKEVEVWDALKEKDPTLSDSEEDLASKLKKEGKLEDAVRRAYGP